MHLQVQFTSVTYLVPKILELLEFSALPRSYSHLMAPKANSELLEQLCYFLSHLLICGFIWLQDYQVVSSTTTHFLSPDCKFLELLLGRPSMTIKEDLNYLVHVSQVLLIATFILNNLEAYKSSQPLSRRIIENMYFYCRTESNTLFN